MCVYHSLLFYIPLPKQRWGAFTGISPSSIHPRNRRAMIETTPAAPWLGRSSNSPRREGKRGGSRFDPRKAALRPTTRGKILVGAMPNYHMPTHMATPNGWASCKTRPHRVGTNERAVRPKLEWRSPSPPRRVRGAAAPPTPDDTPSGALATGRGARWPRRLERGRDGPGDWKGGEMEVEEEFESALEAGGWRGSDRMFLSIVFSFCHILSGREAEKGKGLPYNDGKVVSPCVAAGLRRTGTRYG